MNEKYKILTTTPQVCKRLFGIDFVLLEAVIAKVQNRGLVNLNIEKVIRI